MIINSWYCDLCEKRLFSDDGTIIIKAIKPWYSFECHGKSKIKIIICDECQEKIKKFFKGE